MIVAVLDACVLYSSSLRDLLLRLAEVEAYIPKWTAEIEREWTANLLLNNQSIEEARIRRTCKLMNQAFSEAMVTAYEARVPSLSLPDPHDRHVLAAAIQCSAGFIVTYDLAHFPLNTLEPLGVNAVHPDVFLQSLYEDAPETFVNVVSTHRAALRNPAKSPDQYIQSLVDDRLHELARILHSRRSDI